MRRIKVILAALAAMSTMTVLSAPAMVADFEIDGINGTDVSGANFAFGSPDFLAVGNFSGAVDDDFLGPFGIDDGSGQGVILVGDVGGDVALSGPQTFMS